MSKTANNKPRPEELLVKLVVGVLDDLKAEAVTCLDVRHLTSVTDVMIIANGRSARHVRAVAAAIVERCKENDYRAVGVEGQESGKWVLVDLADVVVHVMQPTVREFYDLESLWDIDHLEGAEESL